jgi:hypothetical protein
MQATSIVGLVLGGLILIALLGIGFFLYRRESKGDAHGVVAATLSSSNFTVNPNHQQSNSTSSNGRSSRASVENTSFDGPPSALTRPSVYDETNDALSGQTAVAETSFYDDNEDDAYLEPSAAQQKIYDGAQGGIGGPTDADGYELMSQEQLNTLYGVNEGIVRANAQSTPRQKVHGATRTCVQKTSQGPCKNVAGAGASLCTDHTCWFEGCAKAKSSKVSFCTVRVFGQKLTLEDAIVSHACSLEASRHVTNGIPLGCSLLLPVHTVNCVQTLKVKLMQQSKTTTRNHCHNTK